MKMKKKILNNLGLKLLSVLIALVLWFVVVMTNNPKDTKRLYNIPVTLTNVELLADQGKVYAVLDNTDMVTVTVEMPRDKMSELSPSDIVAEADVSKLTEINSVPISCYVINEDLNVSNITCSRDAVRLSVEDKIDRWFNVEYRQLGEVAEGYIVDNVERNPTRINVSGPRSAIEKIGNVVVEADVTNATSDVSVNVDPAFYDKEGNLLPPSNITKNEETVHVDVKVLATKEVPVEVNYKGTPAEGYLLTGEVKCEPSSVMISGTLGTLATVNKIVIPEEDLDITGATETYTANISIRKYVPTYVNLVDNGTLTNGRAAVSVVIEPEAEKTLTIPERNIHIQELPEGFRVQFAEDGEPHQLTISGLNAAVSAVDQNTLSGTVDIGQWMESRNWERLTEGTYDIPVSFELPSGVKAEAEMYVRVNIVELEEEE